MNKNSCLDYTNCNLCGNDKTKLLIDLSKAKNSRLREFRIVQCEQCGLIFLNPRPCKSDMDEFYPENYLPFNKKAIEDEVFTLIKWLRRHKLEKMSKAIKKYFAQSKGALLDVGCSTGLFINHMAQQGWSVTGVEPNFLAAQYAKNRFGLNVINETIESVSLPKASFDVITYWDVMEHVYDPMSVFYKTHQLLKENGLLLINFPPAESYSRNKFKDSWIGYDPPRHLFVYSRETMKQYLNKTGFEILSWVNIITPFFAYALSIDQYYSEHYSRTNRVIMKIINFPGMRFFFEPFFYYNFLIGKADLLTVIARKNRPYE